jgi:hypothetical protein
MIERLKSYKANGGKWTTLQTDLGISRPSFTRWMQGKPMSRSMSKLLEYYLEAQSKNLPLPKAE